MTPPRLGLPAALACLLAFSGVAPAAATPAEELGEFVKNPTARGLTVVRKACRKGVLPAESLDRSLRVLEARPSLLAARALIVFRLSCSDGALSEDIDGVLGVEFLSKHAGILVSALALENADDALLRELAASEGKSGDGAFVDCDETCAPRIASFYDRKAAAIRAMKPSGAPEKRIQDALLARIADARSVRTARPPK